MQASNPLSWNSAEFDRLTIGISKTEFTPLKTPNSSKFLVQDLHFVVRFNEAYKLCAVFHEIIAHIT